ncbi:MAG TPA: ankyrin repeat domain-containing protein [bacterium]|nr:ankyrin repeat domain-containing protein [bacterium]
MGKANKQKPDSKAKAGCFRYPLIVIIAFFIYAPPVCVSKSQNHIFVDGPSDLYDIHSLARRGKTPLVIIYTLFSPKLVNSIDDGKTPLHLAAANGHTFMVHYLVWIKADVNNRGRTTPLEEALISAANINRANRIAKYLIDHGSKINPKSGRAPLSVAVSYCNTEMASYLIDKGADVNYGSPILLATRCDGNMLKLLVDHGANINARYRDGRTFLHQLVLEMPSPRYELFPILAENGIDLNAQDEQGNTFVHLAVNKGDIKFIELAIEYGAAVNINNNEGKSPLDLALEKPKYKITEIIINQLINEASIK